MKCATYAAYISLSLWWIRLTMHICTGQKLNSAIYPFRNYGLDLEVNEQEEKNGCMRAHDTKRGIQQQKAPR